MVKIQLATGFLDVQEGTAFPLNFQVGDIRDISQRKGNFSKTITLTGSKNNNNLLNHYYDVNIVEGTFNINALTTCAVIQDGIPIMEDCSMQLTGVVKTQLTDGYEEHVTYEVLVKDSKADFFTAIANKELTDIDFSDLNHVYNAFNVVNRFSNTVVDGFKYFLPASTNGVYSTQEFKPAIFAKTYFDRIFEDAGFTYTWPTMGYDRFEKLFIPYNGGVDNLDYQDWLVKAEKTAPTTINGANNWAGFSNIASIATTQTPATKINLTGWTELDDIQGQFDPITGVYSTPFFNISAANAQSYDYSITMTYSLNLVNTSGGTLYGSAGGSAANVYYKPAVGVGIPGLPIIFSNLFTNTSPNATLFGVPNAVQCPLTIPVGTTNILTQTVQTTIPLSYTIIGLGSSATLGINVSQQYATIGNVASVRNWRKTSPSGLAPASGQVVIQAVISNILISIVPSSNINAIASSAVIEVNDYVPKKIKQSDFIKGIFNMYNIYAQVDSTQPNKLLLQNRDDFYDSGVEVDWTAKLAKDQEQNLSFLPELTSKKIILTYAEDKDNPNTTYTNATNNIYGQAEVIFDNEYVKDVDTKDVLFSPTPVIKTQFGAYVPMIAGAAPETNIRILYDKTTAGQPLATCGQFYIYDYGSLGQINLTSYPLVGHFDDPLTPTFDINFAICDYYYYQPTSLTENNLYNRYWRRTMGQINNGKMLTAMFNLKEPDIQAMKLNDKIRIDNSWWNINKVIDYDANANKLTKVELISIDSEINFTPFMGPSGPNIPTPPAGIGPIQMMAMSNINTTRMVNSNVFGDQATATVMGRGNVIVGGTRSVIVGDDRIISENTLAADSLMVSSLNGVATGIVPLIYIANLTQAGLTDPIAQVKNDSLGGVTWTRTGVGTYEGYLDGFEPSYISSTNVPTIMINNVNFDGVISAQYSTSSNTVSVTTTQIGIGFVDGYLDGTTIEIKYYI
jgi:hypothetical protein